MLLRANTLAKGFSGARVDTVELLIECFNRGVLPVVPARGSVGASGDLAPLAHLALPLGGEGRGNGRGPARRHVAEALQTVGLAPLRLASKEGLSLVNGTQFMTSMAALGVVRARRLAATADLADGALSLEALQGSRTSFTLGCAPSQDRSRGSGMLLPTSGGCSTARRSSSRTAGATRCRTRTPSAARRRCTVHAATSSTTSRRPWRSSSTPRPTTRSFSSTTTMIVSGGELPRTAARVRARRARDGGRGAREHLRAPRGAARQPCALGRAAAVPASRRAGSTRGS